MVIQRNVLSAKTVDRHRGSACGVWPVAALALCDWSELQKTRRSIARMYCSPRTASAHFDALAVACDAEAVRLLRAFDARVAAAAPCGGAVRAKPLLQMACANIFTGYMCSTTFDYDDPAFQHMVNNFDEIFWEINQGYAVDFLPWLRPAYSSHLRKIQRWASEIRTFIMAHIIGPRREAMAGEGEAMAGEGDAPPRDFTEALLRHLDADPDLNWEHVIFELEDFVGGHSAVGNLAWLLLGAAARDPRVLERVRAEADAATGGGARPLAIFDRARMPYTDAAILETLRVASSPIVPHVSTQDTDIAGYAVEKGTVVFLNNYELNTSPQHWHEPERFQPERFLSPDGTRVVKPDFFIPFSTGKRTCIGQRLVQSITFLLAGALLQRYDVSVVEEERPHSLPACVALPPHTYPLAFRPRASSAA
ncbi:Cytochrome P450 307a1 [Gryllus bimaculatus]|nr:Cytochrome P450 307a1 [Gryllus bimaculatus]